MLDLITIIRLTALILIMTSIGLALAKGRRNSSVESWAIIFLWSIFLFELSRWPSLRFYRNVLKAVLKATAETAAFVIIPSVLLCRYLYEDIKTFSLENEDDNEIMLRSVITATAFMALTMIMVTFGMRIGQVLNEARKSFHYWDALPIFWIISMEMYYSFFRSHLSEKRPPLI